MSKASRTQISEGAPKSRVAVDTLEQAAREARPNSSWSGRANIHAPFNTALGHVRTLTYAITFVIIAASAALCTAHHFLLYARVHLLGMLPGGGIPVYVLGRPPFPAQPDPSRTSRLPLLRRS